MITHYLLDSDHEERWKAALPVNSCVMGSIEYCKNCEEHIGSKAHLFVVESGDLRIVHPFFIHEIPFLDSQAAPLFDINTPEYTGPMFIGEGINKEDLASEYKQLFSSFCRDHHIVAEFGHLNPWSMDMDILESSNVETNREIVYLDLSWGEQDIWTKSLSSDSRRQMKQSIKAGVKVRKAETERDIIKFHRLYLKTMDRRNAKSNYYFTLDYFLNFHHSMADNTFFMLAEYQGDVVAGGFYLFDSTTLYWHLSVMDMAFSHVRPVNAYHYSSICWGIQAGKQRLLCGGGYEPDDGVFRFKAGFSPLRMPFKVFKKIHDPIAYLTLLKKWEERSAAQRTTNFFPVYRSVALPMAGMEVN